MSIETELLVFNEWIIARDAGKLTVINAADVMTFSARRTGIFEFPLALDLTLRDEIQFSQSFKDENMDELTKAVVEIAQAKQLPDTVIGLLRDRMKHLLPLD